MIERMPRTGVDAAGKPLQCRATTRRGTACQRVPLHSNGYCPSHQHLAETEELEAMSKCGRTSRNSARAGRAK
jgi:hypothetical protein